MHRYVYPMPVSTLLPRLNGARLYVVPPPPEQWKRIRGFPRYEVSSHGRVRRIEFVIKKRGGYRRVFKTHVLRPHFNWRVEGKDYLRVTLTKVNRKTKITEKHHFYVHRLVAAAFVPKGRSYAPCVHHVDENKHNNAYWNLVWVTWTEHAHIHMPWLKTAHEERYEDAPF